MDEQTRTQIINDGIENGMLIRTCLGCGRPLSKADAEKIGEKQCNDCPAGSALSWNSVALKAIKS